MIIRISACSCSLSGLFFSRDFTNAIGILRMDPPIIFPSHPSMTSRQQDVRSCSKDWATADRCGRSAASARPQCAVRVCHVPVFPPAPAGPPRTRYPSRNRWRRLALPDSRGTVAPQRQQPPLSDRHPRECPIWGGVRKCFPSPRSFLAEKPHRIRSGIAEPGLWPWTFPGGRHRAPGPSFESV